MFPKKPPAEKKSSPEAWGVSDGAGGLRHIDEPDDLPPDYYHDMWRQHDHKRLADPRERKGNRDAAQSWPRRAFNAQGPQFFIRLARHQYRQPDEFCFITCAVFMYFRRSGFSPALAISCLAGEWFKKNIPLLQAEYFKNYNAFALSNSDSDCWTHVLQKLQRAQKAGKFASTAIPHPLGADDIWYLRCIGSYPYVHQDEQQSKVYLARGKNFVFDTARAPSSTPAQTMHQALFSAYQEPRTSKMPISKNMLGRTLFAQRGPSPYVVLSLYFWFNGKPEAHAILIDFTDPLHPGIFDPNFGWMEPAQGFCFLSFELALHTLWEYYTQQNTKGEFQGLKHHVGALPPNTYMMAHQFYEQALMK